MNIHLTKVTEVTEVPIFPGEIMLQRLSGLSGSSVYLFRSLSNKLFVRKVSNSPETSSRLKQQYHKLLAFQEFDFPYVTSPKILKREYHNDCFYMDLEYVNGLDLIEYLSVADVSQLENLGKRLGVFLLEMAKQPALEKVPENATQLFYDKTCTLIEDCYWLSDELKVKLFLNIKKITQSMNQKISLCHGDLTLENILIDQDEQIILIDHLDSFCPHYWQDISKLHQDLSGEWFRFRRPNTTVPKYVLYYLSHVILEYIHKFDSAYNSVHHGLLALVFARILPYTKNNETRQFVMSRVSHYLNLSLE